MANKTIKVGINGFGRIGRAFLKIAWDKPEIEIVAVNDLGDVLNMAYLLKHDTVYRTWSHKVETKGQPARNASSIADAGGEKSKDITILQIDAHQDLRDDDRDYSNNPSKYAHSAVMRRAHELGFPIVQVGIRTFSKYEYNFWQKNKNIIKVFPWTKNAKIPAINEIVKSIKTKKVYLSLDVDGIDPSFMPGTGTPVQGGLEWNYTLNLIEKLFQAKDVIGADIVEVSPQESSVLTEYGAAQLCYAMITNKFRKKLK